MQYFSIIAQKSGAILQYFLIIAHKTSAILQCFSIIALKYCNNSEKYWLILWYNPNEMRHEPYDNWKSLFTFYTWLFFSPLPLIFARSVLWVCHVDSPQIENPSNLSNFLSVQLLNHDFKKKSLWEPPAVTMKNIILLIQISLYPGLIFTPNILRFTGVWSHCNTAELKGFYQERDIVI